MENLTIYRPQGQKFGWNSDHAPYTAVLTAVILMFIGIYTANSMNDRGFTVYICIITCFITICWGLYLSQRVIKAPGVHPSNSELYGKAVMFETRVVDSSAAAIGLSLLSFIFYLLTLIF